MNIIKMSIRNQRLWRYSSGVVAEGSYGYLKMEFNFKTDDWNAASNKTAIFSYKGKNYEAKLDENNQCYVRKEVIKEPYFAVSLYGDGITTNTVKIPVEHSNEIDDNTNTQSAMVFVPEISDRKILSWTIKEVTSDMAVPGPTDLNPFDEWENDETVSEYVWEEE